MSVTDPCEERLELRESFFSCLDVRLCLEGGVIQLPSMLDLLLLFLLFLSCPAQELSVEADSGKSVDAFGVITLGDKCRNELSGVNKSSSSPPGMSVASSEKSSLIGVSLPLSNAI